MIPSPARWARRGRAAVRRRAACSTAVDSKSLRAMDDDDDGDDGDWRGGARGVAADSPGAGGGRALCGWSKLVGLHAAPAAGRSGPAAAVRTSLAHLTHPTHPSISSSRRRPDVFAAQIPLTFAISWSGRACGLASVFAAALPSPRPDPLKPAHADKDQVDKTFHPTQQWQAPSPPRPLQHRTLLDQQQALCNSAIT